MSVSPVPEGFRSITPHLVVRGAERAIEFYERAFGAKVCARHAGPGGLVLYASLRIGDSMIALGDEFPTMQGWVSPEQLGGTTVAVQIYTEDVDAFWKRALEGGAQVVLPIMDMFWGDRYGRVRDPFGHEWSIAEQREVVPDDEVARRAAAFFASLAGESQSETAIRGEAEE